MKKAFFMLSLCSLMLIGVPVYAETQTITMDSSSTTIVTADVESNFSIQIPKTIVLNDNGEKYEANYNISLTGDIAGNEGIFVIPEEKVFLESDGKEGIDVLVTQDKTEWYYDEFNIVANGNISTSELSAGEWSGTFNFNIELVEYTSFTLLQSNYTQAGIIREGDVEIPKTFEYDGVNYMVTSIGSGSFPACNNLTSISIPDSVISIGSGAFSGCNGLTNIYIPNSVVSIGAGAFNSCQNIETLIFEDNSNLESIGSASFSGCISLKSVEIPDSVISIEGSAFQGCNSLESVRLPESEVILGEGIFSNTGLVSVTIPDTFTVLRKGMFSNCMYLTSIVVPKSIKTIETYSLLGCNENLYVYYEGSEDEWNLITIEPSSGLENRNEYINYNYNN